MNTAATKPKKWFSNVNCPPDAKTFGLTRFTVTPKDFAPTRFERDQSGVFILRNTRDFSEQKHRFRHER